MLAFNKCHALSSSNAFWGSVGKETALFESRQGRSLAGVGVEAANALVATFYLRNHRGQGAWGTRSALDGGALVRGRVGFF